MSVLPERVYSALLQAYPSGLRRAYGGEMLALMRAMRAEPRHRGVLGGLRLGWFLLRDSLQTLARERAAGIPMRSVPVAGALVQRTPYGDAVLLSLAVFALYIATLAPSVAFWDAGEYMTAAHLAGIPHPPGNPLFVMSAHLWERSLGLIGISPSVSLNLFNAALSAAAHFFWFLIAYSIAGLHTSSTSVRRIGAACAVLLSATAFTVWNQSNVGEKVYTLSMFTVALVSWLMLRWYERRSARLLVAAAFVVALTSTNHLMGVLVAPAALLLVLLTDRAVLLRPRLWAAVIVVALVGLTPQFFLPIRAQQRPILNENEPSCSSLASAAASIYSFGKQGCAPLSSMLNREQYGKPSIKLDPTVYPDEVMPRGPYLIVRQLGNYLQYFNWQWARSVGGSEPLIGGFRPLVTLIFFLLGVLGARAHWRRDRRSAAFVGTLFLTLSLGLVVYMNFEYGFSIALERFPQPEMHEVRERDYFFLISFSVWALWAGTGLLVAWQRASAWLAARPGHARVGLRGAQLRAAPLFVIALLPLGLNWEWASRKDDYAARDWAYNVLMSVDPYGVLFTNGDNDTFPLWYLQEVEGLRRDVTVMVTGYLNTDWYAKQVRDVSAPCAPGQSAADAERRIICQRAFDPAQLRAGQFGHVTAPTQSVLPLTDAQIAGIIATPFIVQEPLKLTAGRIEATIAPGTTMLPADTFVAAIVQASIGQRPIHFTTPSPAVMKLGLFEFTVRQGLVFKLNNGPVQADAETIAMPIDSPMAGVSGAFLDLPGTERRLNQHFIYRGRLLNPGAPFVDRAVSNIMLQYAWAHLSVAQAYDRKGISAGVQRHGSKADWWQALTE